MSDQDPVTDMLLGVLKNLRKDQTEATHECLRKLAARTALLTDNEIIAIGEGVDSRDWLIKFAGTEAGYALLRDVVHSVLAAEIEGRSAKSYEKLLKDLDE